MFMCSFPCWRPVVARCSSRSGERVINCFGVHDRSRNRHVREALCFNPPKHVVLSVVRCDMRRNSRAPVAVSFSASGGKMRWKVPLRGYGERTFVPGQFALRRMSCPAGPTNTAARQARLTDDTRNPNLDPLHFTDTHGPFLRPVN